MGLLGKLVRQPRILYPSIKFYRFSLNFYRKIFASINFIPTFASDLSIIIKNKGLKLNEIEGNYILNYTTEGCTSFGAL